MSETLTGTVRWFNDTKGHGSNFQEAGKDDSVHDSAIQRPRGFPAQTKKQST